jgi:glutamate racemase
MWVPLVENRAYRSDGADFFIRQNLEHIFSLDAQIDTLVLGCTHYPLLEPKIRKYLPDKANLVVQGPYVAGSLKSYLSNHPEITCRLSKKGACRFLTTETAEKFSEMASLYLNRSVMAETVVLDL